MQLMRENEQLVDSWSKKRLLCIGNGKKHPNIDAIPKTFKKIYGLCTARLNQCQSIYLPEAYMPDSIKQIENKPEGRIYIMGHSQ